jgi:hypothetical protein
MNHDTLRKLTLIEANKIPGVKLWPNPQGLGILGKVIRRINGKTSLNMKLDPNKSYAVIEYPRQVKFGLAKGSSDLVGFKTEQIGSIKIPRFLGLEIKVGRDKLRAEQENFMNTLNGFGGLGAVVKDNTDNLKNILTMPMKRLY